jgi:hypothetical protein
MAMLGTSSWRASTSETNTCIMTGEGILLLLLISDLIVHISHYFNYVQVPDIVSLCVPNSVRSGTSCGVHPVCALRLCSESML